ncbi:MAG: helix-turn-helix transcriptional regulator [Dehalococcoidales bacterium]|nr:helix-turn-helix transcriptional regulator [Dehalococcoidales bacterium]
MKNRLKVFRAMHDLTQEELAKKLGVTRQTVVSIENGRYDPSLGLAFCIAGTFNVKIEDIFEYEGPAGDLHGLPPASPAKNRGN